MNCPSICKTFNVYFQVFDARCGFQTCVAYSKSCPIIELVQELPPSLLKSRYYVYWHSLLSSTWMERVFKSLYLSIILRRTKVNHQHKEYPS